MLGLNKKQSTTLGWLFALGLGFASTGCGTLANNNNVQGKRLYEQGQYNEALSSFQKAVQRDPNNADTYYNMARTYHHLGQTSGNDQYMKQAEILYNDCLNRDANHEDCYRGLAVLLIETDRKESAFTLLRRWNASNPVSADPKLELARLYKEFGDSQQAQDLVADALRVDPQDARANRAMGMLREEQGQLAEALDSYQRAFSSNAMQADLREKIASLQQSVAAQYAGQTGARTASTASTVPVPTGTF